ncbi:hypothetical protein [Listeria sp. ILCC797]|uniref:hypothetical protein n=1 Tax=Listeria sp. ILCC797 TaxID=1918333 RepID=UPI000B595689|nr:hypothetical protein [Listeria sp. ILCC797]
MEMMKLHTKINEASFEVEKTIEILVKEVLSDSKDKKDAIKNLKSLRWKVYQETAWIIIDKAIERIGQNS